MTCLTTELQRYSLEYAGVSAAVVEAFDINEVANDVYEHNFGHRPNQVLALVSLVVEILPIIQWS